MNLSGNSQYPNQLNKIKKNLNKNENTIPILDTNVEIFEKNDKHSDINLNSNASSTSIRDVSNPIDLSAKTLQNNFIPLVLRETTVRQPTIKVPISSPRFYRNSPGTFNISRDWLINYIQDAHQNIQTNNESDNKSNIISSITNNDTSTDEDDVTEFDEKKFNKSFNKINYNEINSDDQEYDNFTPDIKDKIKCIQEEPPNYNRYYKNLFIEEIINSVEDSFVTFSQKLKDITSIDTYIKIQIITWNMQGKTSPPKDIISKFIRNPNSQHLYIFGSQECERSIASSMLFRSKENWESTLKELLGPAYQIVGSSTLVATHCIVFAHKEILPYISDVVTSSVPTGFLNGSIGNKGCASVSCRIGSFNFMFLCCHLAAHQENIEQRNSSYHKIINEIEFKGKSRPQDKIFKYMDYIFIFGDLNYRINGNRDQIDQCLKVNDQDCLLSNDQLSIERRMNHAFSEFEEGQVLFLPTYKFSWVNGEEYETKKNRNPSWTDRILYYNINDLINSKIQKSELENESDNQFSLPNIKLLEYNSMNIRYSDHKPVIGRFLCKFENSQIKMNQNRLDEQYSPTVSSSVCTIQ